MDRIAFIYGETFIYWYSVIMTLGTAVAIALFLSFYFGMGGKVIPAACAVPVSLVLSLVLGRLVHWYCRADSYESMAAAMTNYTTGGYALMGAFAACLITAVVLWLLRLEKSLPRMLDAMSIGGCAGIAVGRLACLFSAADRGQILENLKELPFAYPVTNAVSGALEYRLATFMLQAMLCGVIFVLLALFCMTRLGRRGDTTWFFLLLYGAAQAVLDSTRYDSLYFRSNGFVSIVQILGAAAVLVTCVVFSVRMVQARGFRVWYLALWVPMAGLLGLAGYMEYYVQRHGDQAVFAYRNMSISLGVIVVLAAVIYFYGRRRKTVYASLK